MRSKYIVIEGLEGAGKTTARNVVVDTLKSLGVADMVFTREPGGTQLAEKLRSLVLDIKSVGDEVITDKAEVLMFYAARVQLVETVIKPALAEGKWVIGDRHDLSTQAYQGGGRGIDQTMLATLLTNPDAWPLVSTLANRLSGAILHAMLHEVCQSREQLLTVTGLNRELLLTDQLLRIEHYLQPGVTPPVSHL